MLPFIGKAPVTRGLRFVANANDTTQAISPGAGVSRALSPRGRGALTRGAGVLLLMLPSLVCAGNCGTVIRGALIRGTGASARDQNRSSLRELNRLYSSTFRLFNQAENGLYRRVTAAAAGRRPEARRAIANSFYSHALAKSDPLFSIYRHAAAAGEAYLRLAGRFYSRDHGIHDALYWAGLAEYSTGDNSSALRSLERLQREYCDYGHFLDTTDRALADRSACCRWRRTSPG